MPFDPKKLQREDWHTNRHRYEDEGTWYEVNVEKFMEQNEKPISTKDQRKCMPMPDTTLPQDIDDEWEDRFHDRSHE